MKGEVSLFFLLIISFFSCQGPSADQQFESKFAAFDGESLSFLWWESTSIQEFEISKEVTALKAIDNESLSPLNQLKWKAQLNNMEALELEVMELSYYQRDLILLSPNNLLFYSPLPREGAEQELMSRLVRMNRIIEGGVQIKEGYFCKDLDAAQKETFLFLNGLKKRSWMDHEVYGDSLTYLIEEGEHHYQHHFAKARKDCFEGNNVDDRLGEDYLKDFLSHYGGFNCSDFSAFLAEAEEEKARLEKEVKGFIGNKKNEIKLGSTASFEWVDSLAKKYEISFPIPRWILSKPYLLHGVMDARAKGKWFAQTTDSKRETQIEESIFKFKKWALISAGIDECKYHLFDVEGKRGNKAYPFSVLTLAEMMLWQKDGLKLNTREWEAASKFGLDFLPLALDAKKIIEANNN